MANIPKEMTKRFEERSQVHREQQDMLQVQQESICLTRSQKISRPTLLPARVREQKEGESSTSEKTESEDNSNSEPPKSPSEEEGDLENRDIHSRRMNGLEKCLEAITNRSNLQEAGVVRPYPVEWDIVSKSSHKPCKPLTVKVP